MDFYCENFEKQNTGSCLKQIWAPLVIYGIFRNSGNSKWNFSGIGHILPNLTMWDIFPTQFWSLSSIFHSEFANSNYLGIPVKFRNSQWNFKKWTQFMKWDVNSTQFQAQFKFTAPIAIYAQTKEFRINLNFTLMINVLFS